MSYSGGMCKLAHILYGGSGERGDVVHLLLLLPMAGMLAVLLCVLQRLIIFILWCRGGQRCRVLLSNKGGILIFVLHCENLLCSFFTTGVGSGALTGLGLLPMKYGSLFDNLDC